MGGHGFNPGGADLDAQLVHGADCDECHDFLRQMTADRCCYRARRAELLAGRPEIIDRR